MLEIWTRGLYRATPHRVRNRTTKDRLSVPFFFDPNFNSVVRPLPHKLLFPDQIVTPEQMRKEQEEAAGPGILYGKYILNKVLNVFPDLGEGALKSM